MKNKIQRFEPAMITKNEMDIMTCVKDDTGDYVTYEDHKAILSEIQKEYKYKAETLHLRSRALDVAEDKITTLLELLKQADEGLSECLSHFNSIRSGLTTDINRVEMETKQLAHAAHCEASQVREAIADKLKELGL